MIVKMKPTIQIAGEIYINTIDSIIQKNPVLFTRYRNIIVKIIVNMQV